MLCIHIEPIVKEIEKESPESFTSTRVEDRQPLSIEYEFYSLDY